MAMHQLMAATLDGTREIQQIQHEARSRGVHGDARAGR
jgi:phosphoketolase